MNNAAVHDAWRLLSISDFRKVPESVEPAWNGQMPEKVKKARFAPRRACDLEDVRSIIQASND
jgi:hypothetical protein